MPDARELLEGESHLAAAALLELRPHFETPERIAQRIDEQRAGGYRIVGSFETGEAEAAAVAGFRIGTNTAWGLHVYVDDLVTRASHRSRGHADAVMAWVEAEARAAGCAQLHLDSGLGPDRADAHRFYFRHGLTIVSHHFGKRIG